MSSGPSWLDIPVDSHFSLHNIPFGIITTPSNTSKRVGTAIGSYAVDLGTFFHALDTKLSFVPDMKIFTSPTLNAFAALGSEARSEVRQYIQSVLSNDSKMAALLRDNKSLQEKVLVPLTEVTMHLPFQIGDYTDFYVGLHHAMNCGRLMRGPGQELQPNYKHLPVGYHGRASSVVVSGTPITRPSGQIKPPDSDRPVFSACRRLDFELELGCFVAKGNAMGTPVRLDEAKSHLFGVVLLNDWSARDIQTWEMVPLGPFNAKNFGTSISPWVVTMEALESFLVPGLESERDLLPYLRGESEGKIPEIALEVQLKSKCLSSYLITTNIPISTEWQAPISH
jgi:fumarylacetoacetase